MAYMALARRWRPRRFDQMTGQEHVLQALGNALDSGRLHHAFLFAGTRGVGKTSVARILAKCLNCERGVSRNPCDECASCREIDDGRSVDLIEVDAASRTKVDDTRDLLDNVQYAPTRSRFKIYLIDEVHMLSTHSFNALLKTLEEPPPHVKFLLATTDPQKLPVTVLSRCLQFNLKRLPIKLIAARMQQILEAEKIAFEPAALQLLAHAGDGSLRDALSLLDQLLAFGDGRAGEAAARAMLGTVDRSFVVRIAELLASGELAILMDYAQSIEEWAPDYAQLLEQLAGLLERVALMQALPDYAGDELYPADLLRSLVPRVTPEDVQLYYQTAILGRRDLPLAPDPRAGFRMTLLRMLAFRPAAAGAGQPVVAGGGAEASKSRLPTPSSPAATAVAAESPASASPGDWGQILSALDLQGAARQLAANCSLLERQGNLLRLALDPRSSLVRTRAQEEKLAQALSRHFGTAMRVDIAVCEAPAESPARERERQTQQQLDQVRTAFAADATVRSLQQRFGATIHPDSVRPAKPS